MIFLSISNIESPTDMLNIIVSPVIYPAIIAIILPSFLVIAKTLGN